MRAVHKATVQSRLAELRLDAGVSRLQFAIALGVDPSTVWRWENEGVPGGRLLEVADYFRVSVDHLLGRDEEAA
jgi:transcriptional regulator with XRE-family HTH domain